MILFAPSGLYHGYLDMSCFALFPPALCAHKSKIAEAKCT